MMLALTALTIACTLALIGFARYLNRRFGTVEVLARDTRRIQRPHWRHNVLVTE
jgi:hypothetical protein